MPVFGEQPPTPPPSPAFSIDEAFELVYGNNHFNEELARHWIHTHYLHNAAYTRTTHSHRELWDESFESEFGSYNPDIYIEVFEPGTPEPEGEKEPVLRQHNNLRKQVIYKKVVNKAARRKRGGS